MKHMKPIALLLAMSIMLTTFSGCGSETAAVTNVSEKPFTVNDREGLYTGEWKSKRPNGNGELIISDTEYYKGEWCDGMLLGQGEFALLCDDGSYMHYEGKCADDMPIGEGTMTISSADSPYLLTIRGNFADESTLMCFTTDDVQKLCDIGIIRNGEFISCVDNPNAVEGITAMRVINDKGFTYNDNPGKYIGETDENGIPNGYGYFELYPVTNEYTNQCIKYNCLGSWKDGYIEGYYTSLWDNGMVGVKTVGCMTGGRDVGEYESYTYDSYGLTVEKMNYDTYDNYDNFELGDDGIYRGSYKETEYFSNDGTYGYNKRRKTYKLLDDGSYDLEYALHVNDEGEYCNYDRYGNVIDYGVPLESGWQSLQPNDITLKDVLITAGVVLLGAYATYKFIIKPANEEMLKLSGVFETRQKSINLKKDLVEKAKREDEQGFHEAAERLLEEADRVTMPAISY